jgi:hypothetical protein
MKPHLCIATPTYGESVSLGYHNSMLRLVSATQHVASMDVTVLIQGGNTTYASRELLTEKFFSTEADFILWIDSDITFTPVDVSRMLMALGRVGERAMVTGMYRRKSPLLTYDLEVAEQNDDEGLRLLNATGAGFLGMDRDRLAELKRSYSCVWEPFDGKSEDIAFCHRWRKAGGRIYLDDQIKLGHVGTYEFLPIG